MLSTHAPRPSLADAAARTPADRDRFVDLARALSVATVVLGHWTMAGLERTDDGLRLRNVLEVATWAHPLTWLAQVMPVFFFAAGFTNALALGRGRTRATAFVAGRVRRVLAPTLVFVPAWLTLAVVLPHLGAPARLVDSASTAASMPLWFLAVYVLVALIAPAQYRLHTRHRIAVLLGLATASAALDVLRIHDLAPAASMLSFLTVFGFAQELGFWYADGSLTRVRRSVWAGVAAAAVVALTVVTHVGPYPVSMVGLPGESVSNMMPPSICVVLVGVLQVSLLMLARPALLRVLERGQVWRAVIAVNVLVMPIFLWHLSAYLLAAALLLGGGVPTPALASGGWWLLKVIWLALAAAIAIPLVRLMSRVEVRLRAASVGWAGVAGAVLCAAGLAVIAAAGLADPFARGGVPLGGVTVAPAWGVALLGVGALLVGGRRARQATGEPTS